MENIEEIKNKVIDLDSKMKQIMISHSDGKTTYAERVINQFYFNKYLEEYHNYQLELRTRLVNDINNSRVLKLKK